MTYRAAELSGCFKTTRIQLVGLNSYSHPRYNNDNAANAPPMTVPNIVTLNAPPPTERRWKIPVATTRDSQDRTILALHADAPRRACVCDDEIHAAVQGLTDSRGTYPSSTYPGHQNHQTLLTSLDAFSMREMSAMELER